MILDTTQICSNIILILTASKNFKTFTMANMSKMFAYVRFKADNFETIVDCKHIKDFFPKNENDFEGDVWYEIRWQNAYTEGQIALLNCK